MGMEEWLDKYPPKSKDKKKEQSSGTVPPPSRKRLIKQTAQRTLDLHGFTAEEARAEVEAFLRESKKQGVKKVLIIHGKGYHSQGKPVLKQEVLKILERNPAAGEFGVAGRNEGGSGAVWVLLK